MDTDVIEAVLRSNDGAVDDTIDQLLTMSIDSDDRDFVDIPPELISPVCLLAIICYINAIVIHHICMLVLYLYVICEYSAAEKYIVTCYFGYTCRLIVK